MIKRYWTNTLHSNLSDDMKVGTEIVLYSEYLAEIADKDRERREETCSLMSTIIDRDKQIAALTAERNLYHEQRDNLANRRNELTAENARLREALDDIIVLAKANGVSSIVIRAQAALGEKEATK